MIESYIDTYIDTLLAALYLCFAIKLLCYQVLFTLSIYMPVDNLLEIWDNIDTSFYDLIFTPQLWSNHSMTKKELIEALASYDDNATVVITFNYLDDLNAYDKIQNNLEKSNV